VPRSFSPLLTLVPTAALAAATFSLAWREQGSTVASDWLAYALGAGLVLATVLASGTAVLPRRLLLAGLAGVAALSLWVALSISWSPVPALARDEALLIVFYGFVLAVPLVTLATDGARLAALTLIIVAGVALGVATSVRLVVDGSPAELYFSGRLAWPIRYPGAQAAILLVAFWPAAAIAASRRLPVALRTVAFAGSVAVLAGWILTQSRASGVSLAISAVLVFALAPARLRLLVPVTLAGALAAASYFPLTEPFRAEATMLEDAIHDAGWRALALSVAGLGLGVAYALVDRRFTVPARVTRGAQLAAAAALVLAASGGLVAFGAAVDRPGDYLQDRWDEFKHQPEFATGSSHLTSLGSNRYDFWRVALNEFREHPVAGGGARSFGTAYLVEGRSGETPRRAHSLELDLISETGIVGLALFGAALGPFVWIVVRRGRSDLVGAGAFGGVAYWLIHASGDWTWTFPAVGVPFFLLLGASVAGSNARRVDGRSAVLSATAVAVAALILFGPPWLSSRYTSLALGQNADAAAAELRWARRLDPLSIEPLIAEAELAASPAQAIPPLEEAVAQEPRSHAPHYLLGVAYFEAGRNAEARRELREALRLAPRSRAVRRALRRPETARRGG
jgi:hypothetical protein